MSPVLPLWEELYFNEWSDSIGFLWATSSWFFLCLALCRWLGSGSPVSISFAASDALHRWGCSLPSQSSFVTCAHRLLDMALLEKPVCSVHLCLPLHTSAPLGSEFQVPSDCYETRYSRGVHLGSFKSNGACTFNLFPDSLAYYMSPCTWLQNGVFPFIFWKYPFCMWLYLESYVSTVQMGAPHWKSCSLCFEKESYLAQKHCHCHCCLCQYPFITVIQSSPYTVSV